MQVLQGDRDVHGRPPRFRNLTEQQMELVEQMQTGFANIGELEPLRENLEYLATKSPKNPRSTRLFERYCKEVDVQIEQKHTRLSNVAYFRGMFGELCEVLNGKANITSPDHTLKQSLNTDLLTELTKAIMERTDHPGDLSERLRLTLDELEQVLQIEADDITDKIRAEVVGEPWKTANTQHGHDWFPVMEQLKRAKLLTLRLAQTIKDARNPSKTWDDEQEATIRLSRKTKLEGDADSQTEHTMKRATDLLRTFVNDIQAPLTQSNVMLHIRHGGPTPVLEVIDNDSYFTHGSLDTKLSSGDKKFMESVRRLRTFLNTTIQTQQNLHYFVHAVHPDADKPEIWKGETPMRMPKQRSGVRTVLVSTAAITIVLIVSVLGYQAISGDGTTAKKDNDPSGEVEPDTTPDQPKAEVTASPEPKNTKPDEESDPNNPFSTRNGMAFLDWMEQQARKAVENASTEEKAALEQALLGLRAAHLDATTTLETLNNSNYSKLAELQAEFDKIDNSLRDSSIADATQVLITFNAKLNKAVVEATAEVVGAEPPPTEAELAEKQRKERAEKRAALQQQYNDALTQLKQTSQAAYNHLAPIVARYVEGATQARDALLTEVKDMIVQAAKAKAAAEAEATEKARLAAEAKAKAEAEMAARKAAEEAAKAKAEAERKAKILAELQKLQQSVDDIKKEQKKDNRDK